MSRKCTQRKAEARFQQLRLAFSLCSGWLELAGLFLYFLTAHPHHRKTLGQVRSFKVSPSSHQGQSIKYPVEQLLPITTPLLRRVLVTTVGHTVIQISTLWLEDEGSVNFDCWLLSFFCNIRVLHSSFLCCVVLVFMYLLCISNNYSTNFAHLYLLHMLVVS